MRESHCSRRAQHRPAQQLRSTLYMDACTAGLCAAVLCTCWRLSQHLMGPASQGSCPLCIALLRLLPGSFHFLSEHLSID